MLIPSLYPDIRYKRIIINAFSALGENLHFVISGYFVISDLVITGVYCANFQTNICSPVLRERGPLVLN